MAAKKPEWLKLNDDGSATVTLSRPADIAGVKAPSITMREPTVDDQLAMDAVSGSDGVKEISIFANLSMLAPSDISKLPLRDYKRLQVAFGFFID